MSSGEERRNNITAALAPHHQQNFFWFEKNCVGGMPFRLQSKQLFLTYAQCDLDVKEMLEYLTAILPEIEQYVIAKELHANGDHHRHCYFKLKETLDTRDERFADIKIGDQTFHGNY